MDFLYLIFYGCLRLRFLYVETYPGPQHPVPAVCRIICSNVQGLARNLSDLTVASSQYDILLCSETLVSDMHHVSEGLVPSFGHPVLFCRAKMPRARGMAAYIRDGYGTFHQPKFECGCCEMLVFRVCGVRQCGTCHMASFSLPLPRTTTATICSSSSLLVTSFKQHLAPHPCSTPPLRLLRLY